MKKILFNDKYYLTQAVLNGTKTMTRRVLKDNVPLGNWEETEKMLPYKIGEVVAVAQSYKDIDLHDIIGYKAYGQNMYEPIYAELSAGWNNKMFVKSELMPHHIRITDVKVERLQDISDDDALKEGVFKLTDKCFLPSGIAKTFTSAREAFACLIDAISGKGTWESNPWVAAYSFELVENDIVLHTNDVVSYLKSILKECHSNFSKCRMSPTPYASKRKKKHKRKK